MFCYQCEQAAQGTGCAAAMGVCGKDPETAALQDLLVEQARRIGRLAHRARALGVRDAAVDRFLIEALFSTITNVNFDPARLDALLDAGEGHRARLRAATIAAARAQGRPDEAPADDGAPLAADRAGRRRQADTAGILPRRARLGADRAGLQDLLLAGLKGMAAYADHAAILGSEDASVYAFVAEALAFLAEPDPSLEALLAMTLKCGAVNLKVMEMLDAAHTATFGHPRPTPVRIHPRKGKAILVSGHDLKDLEALLQQTAGRGINVYTHGEMLPAHGYPGLSKHPHLAGHYGGAWQDQRAEFDAFPGAILMTTNCIQRPKDSYRARLFTCGLVAWPGVAHVRDRDFEPVIRAALAADGFDADGPDRTILVGFGHHAVLGVADKVVAAVKAKAIRHFFLVGGCDGAKSGRNYYTDFARLVPRDAVILTLACGKFRFNKLEFGEIGGIPRLLDCGQCNDAYSAIRIAGALAQAFGCGLNDLPLSLVLSWYEQKAVCILLTLLHLGVRNIRLGPSLPACVTPAVLAVLADKFGLKPITTPAADLQAILGGA